MIVDILQSYISALGYDCRYIASYISALGDDCRYIAIIHFSVRR